jgi:VWFA-related protein
MIFSIRRFWTLGFGLTLCMAGTMRSAAAQAAATQPTQQQPSAPPPGATVLHTGTQLVVLDVTVHDKKGNPVRGLKRDDFTIDEAKQPQTLRAFDEFSTEATPPVVPQAPKLPAGSFTNYTPVPAKGPLNVLLIDSLNTPLMDQGYLIKQMQEYMKHLAPGTRLAVFGLAGHLYFMQGFTTDPKAMQAVFASIKNGQVSTLLPNSSTDTTALTEALTVPGTATATDNSSALMTGAVSNLLAEMSSSQTANRSQQTIEAFTTLGKWLSSLPGRKNLIWFSASFPLNIDPNSNLPSEDSTIFQLMVNTLTQAQVSVYPVDPRGVQGSPAFHADDTGLSQTSNFSTRNSAFNTSKDAEHSTMQAFASDTGGKAFYNDNYLGVAVDNALNDGANYYTLGYSPSEHKTGGEWRSIHVALNGDLAKAGYTLSYRRGYFAENSKHPDYKTGTGTVSTANYTPEHEGQNYARESMTRGAPMPTDILFTARVLPHSTSPEDTLAAGNVVNPKAPLAPPYRRFDVDVAAIPKYFTLTKQAGGNYAGAIEVAVFVYSIDGKLINTTAKKLTLNLTQDAYEKFEKSAVGVHVEVSAPADKDSVLRIGFQDVPSNKIGALEVATASVKNLQPQN